MRQHNLNSRLIEAEIVFPLSFIKIKIKVSGKNWLHFHHLPSLWSINWKRHSKGSTYWTSALKTAKLFMAFVGDFEADQNTFLSYWRAKAIELLWLHGTLKTINERSMSRVENLLKVSLFTSIATHNSLLDQTVSLLVKVMSDAKSMRVSWSRNNAWKSSIHRVELNCLWRFHSFSSSLCSIASRHTQLANVRRQIIKITKISFSVQCQRQRADLKWKWCMRRNDVHCATANWNKRWENWMKWSRVELFASHLDAIIQPFV